MRMRNLLIVGALFFLGSVAKAETPTAGQVVPPAPVNGGGSHGYAPVYPYPYPSPYPYYGGPRYSSFGMSLAIGGFGPGLGRPFFGGRRCRRCCRRSSCCRTARRRCF